MRLNTRLPSFAYLCYLLAGAPDSALTGGAFAYNLVQEIRKGYLGVTLSTQRFLFLVLPSTAGRLKSTRK
jgi:hypothetical protein